MSQQYIFDIKIVYDSEPNDVVREINNKGNNINKDQGGKHVYLVPVYTTRVADACNSFRLVIQDSEDSTHSDLASGAGGAYRYLLPLSDRKNEDKITFLGLLRSSSAISSPPSGYSGMTSDINRSRKAGYLYIVWKTKSVSFTQVYNSGLTVVYGSMPSQVPRGAMTDISGGSNNINHDFGDSYVWLVNNYTDSPDGACTAFNIVIQDVADDALQELTKGVDGPYRYMLSMQHKGISAKITEARLLRADSELRGPPSGYDGMSSNLNEGREKNYLYIVWKTEQAQCSDYLVSGISITYGSKPSQQSITSVTEINGSGDNINQGFGDSFVWISASYTSVPDSACNSFLVAIQDDRDGAHSNLATGAGGAYRYLLALGIPADNRKITNIRLLRSSSAVSTPPSGYTGMTDDLNAGRGGDHLYVIWTELNLPTDGLYVSAITVKYGTMPSQEPSNAIRTIGIVGDDVNKGFDGFCTWLENTLTHNPADACTSFEVVVQSDADSHLPNLANGAGGDYRYVLPLSDGANPNKIIGTRLLRSNHPVNSPPTGYDGISTNINRGRKGDFLYIIWQTDTVGSTAQWVSQIDVLYGSQPSQQVANTIHEIHGAGDNINRGWDSHAWIVPQYSNYAIDACTSFKLVIDDNGTSAHKDLVKGTGRRSRYLLPVKDASVSSKITGVALLRSSSAVRSPPSPYSGMTSNINEGSSGDYLYLIWRTAPAPFNSADDSFVIFKDVDIHGYDVAHYPGVNTPKLMDIALQKTGSLITAFNTNSWMKTCDPRRKDIWVDSKGSNLYVRMKFAGWDFRQGVDARGHDLYDHPMGTNAPVVMNRIINGPGDDKRDEVAGFITVGWVKYQISGESRWTDYPIDGLYTRLEFSDYAFFPQADSPGNDIVQLASSADRVPELIRNSKLYATCTGFNTNGWVKSQITVPPPSSSKLSKPTQGTYVRVAWPGWAFLPETDSYGNDKTRLTGKQVRELIDAANSDPDIVAFNTNGYMKTALADTPLENTTDPFPLYGLYVRTSSLTGAWASENLVPQEVKPHDRADATDAVADASSVSTILFLMKATALIWGRWFISDAAVRSQYAAAVAAGAADIRARWESGALSAERAVAEAGAMRNSWLRDCHAKSSAIGLLVAQYIKPEGLSVEQTLERYAQRLYSRSFADLDAAQGRDVVSAAVDASGCANSSITQRMKLLGRTGKAIMVIGIVLSMYEVVSAEDWMKEAAVQAGTWSASIVAGTIGTGVGALVGPVGAILGGLAGGFLGGWLGDSALSRWFYGGSSGAAGSSILHAEMFSVLRSMIHATHLTVNVADKVAVTKACEAMITTASTGIRSPDVEVIATIVWIRVDNQILPANAANPADFKALLVWATNNLP